jgi:hypothetical protein
MILRYEPALKYSSWTIEWLLLEAEISLVGLGKGSPLGSFSLIYKGSTSWMVVLRVLV